MENTSSLKYSEKQKITRHNAKTAIAAYNNLGESLKLRAGDDVSVNLSGFSFELEDLRKIVNFLEDASNDPENNWKCKRVFFGLIYHKAGIAGASRTGYGLVAAPIVNAAADTCGSYDENNVPTDNWFVPDEAEIFNYCEPCPAVCPKIQTEPGGERQYFHEINS